jgi:alpha-tubulin suppressor-like RCC1 family protein
VNGNGSLGVGDVTQKTSPTQVGTGATGDWMMVASGRYFGAALKTNGTLWTWGRNNFGQLGLDNATNVSSPVQVGNDTDWLYVRCGRYHVAATKTNGTLWTWGRNNFGQLGLDNTTTQSSPVQVGTGTTGPWVQTFCGQYHTFAKTSTNVLWAWGRNNYRQLGVGTVASLSSPTQLTGNNNSDWLSVSSRQGSTLAVKTNGTIWGWGQAINGIIGARFAESNSPIQVFASTGWTGAEIVGNTAIGLKTDNTIWSWGSQANGYGGLGFFRGGPTSVPVQQGTKNNWSFIAKTVGNDGIAIDADGLMWTWGGRRATYGGLGGVNHISSPVQVGSLLTGWQPNTLISGSAENMLLIRKLG